MFTLPLATSLFCFLLIYNCFISSQSQIKGICRGVQFCGCGLSVEEVVFERHSDIFKASHSEIH